MNKSGLVIIIMAYAHISAVSAFFYCYICYKIGNLIDILYYDFQQPTHDLVLVVKAHLHDATSRMRLSF